MLSRRRISRALIAVVGLVLLGTQAAWATTPSPPFRDGHHGIYALLDDDQGIRGAACHYNGSQLDRIRIRQPIAFAYDRHQSKVDHQWIAWRYVIEGTNDADLNTATWTQVARSGLQKYWTSDKQAAAFQPKTYDVGSSVYSGLRVVVRIYWYDAHNNVDGRVFQAVEDLDDQYPGGDSMFGVCYTTHPV
jgi:hypothetical protein